MDRGERLGIKPEEYVFVFVFDISVHCMKVFEYPDSVSCKLCKTYRGVYKVR